MNCSHAQRLMLEFEDRELPPDVRSHLDACAACRRQREQADFVRRLVALKRYERPSPGMEARCRAGIRRRLEHPEQEPGFARGGVWETLTAWPVPAFRYALATTFALLVAVHLLSLPQLPALQATAPEVPGAPGASRLAALTNPAPAAGRNADAGILVLASNRGPARLDYGPMPSTLVNFEY